MLCTFPVYSVLKFQMFYRKLEAVLAVKKKKKQNISNDTTLLLRESSGVCGAKDEAAFYIEPTFTHPGSHTGT